ncbi:MAG: hypothetical protein GY861_19330 [bacterium]|nr:hypothetical protein [bacterium]
MPGQLPKPRDGKPVKTNCSGFPMFFDKRKPRVLAADAWAFLEYLVAEKLEDRDKKQCLAFIEQAYDFYEAAENPQLGSKPLLYYYSFLNLAKVALILKSILIPVQLKHGISDPGVNGKEEFNLDGQKLHISGRDKNKHSMLFPELVIALGGVASTSRDIELLDVLEQIVSIHRVFTQVTSRKNQFVPIKSIELRTDSSKVWGHVVLDNTDRDVGTTLKTLKGCTFLNDSLIQVESKGRNESWFETKPVKYEGQGMNSAAKVVAARIRSAQLSPILTNKGYLYYFNCIDQEKFLPPLAASFAAMFYLGSLTRYKPADFDDIRASKYGWICEELLATQPTQFLYILCSELAGVDVVVPHSLVVR